MTIVRVAVCDTFQLKGEERVFVVDRRDNPGIKIDNLRETVIKINDRLTFVTAVRLDGKDKNLVGLVSRDPHHAELLAMNRDSAEA